jgi:hypothetical protein
MRRQAANRTQFLHVEGGQRRDGKRQQERDACSNARVSAAA